MRLASWTVALTLVAAWTIAAPFVPGLDPPVARAADDEDRPAAARSARTDLASADDAVRARAAARLVDLGWYGATEIARRGADLDDRAWKACADAFGRVRSSWLAFPFVDAARHAPPAHAKRMLELAHALDPVVGVERTPEETAAEVRRLIDEAGRGGCATGYAERIALLGHAAVNPLLARLRDGEPPGLDTAVACFALGYVAEKQDLPAIRELFLAGKESLVHALQQMQRDGVSEATDALLDAVAAGRTDSSVTCALAEAPDKVRVLQVVNAWIAGQTTVDDGSRANLATLFEKLDARDAVPTLASWTATTKEPGTFVAIAEALVHFRDPRGVGLLVRIASERETRFPCRPSTPQELAAASAPGRLCPDGFAQWRRSDAAQELSAIAGKQVFDVPEDWLRRLAEQGPNRESADDYLDRAAAAFRTWWKASKDRLRFDTDAGRWVVDR